MTTTVGKETAADVLLDEAFEHAIDHKDSWQYRITLEAHEVPHGPLEVCLDVWRDGEVFSVPLPLEVCARLAQALVRVTTNEMVKARQQLSDLIEG